MANGALRTRHDVWKLPAGDTTLQWYGQAVAQLKTKPISDPTSWRYQAAIHDYTPQTDPLRTAGDQIPTNRGQFWQQCQHGCSYFLPWHRAYLFYFEQLIAATVVSLGGPAGWSLPYWNYSDASNPQARQLPPGFYQGGAGNPLYVAQRAPGANDGQVIAGDDDVALDCLTVDHVYYGADDGTGGGFGGAAGNPFHNGSSPGGLELTPHGTIHVAVGGSGQSAGWMSSFDTAALDPLFWLHHANIDRLWQVWLNRDPSHTNPTDARWLGQRFQFHDSTGAAVTMTPQQVLDTTAAPLGYQYEDVTDPFAAAPATGA
ncbi:MAG TPA: tyrosinase family protein [Stellaceae bacterium]|nr:tyrosinase family protein [Stellaceae bacterium]